MILMKWGPDIQSMSPSRLRIVFRS